MSEVDDFREKPGLTYLLPHYEHVPLHRLWTFATLQGELTLPEHAHVLDCEGCRVALRACLQAENFGMVLKTLNRTDDVEDSKDESKAG
jgi:hypothetical protein